LLLADHPDSQQTELVYCGLAPDWRGRGWGLQITRRAQWAARCDSRQRLMLAVDAANRHALAIYAEAGFRAYDRRRVFGKILSAA
jgi:ribosomal protein S18 acetylase RimI-like enzyme